MLPILTAVQMKTCDTYTIETLGISSQILMERAARMAAEILVSRADLFPAEKVLLLCGSGNNGGDGFAMARFLTDGSLPERRKAAIVYTGQYDEEGKPDVTRMSTECRRQYELAAAAGIPILPRSDAPKIWDNEDISVVDAVFGIGLDRPVEGEIAHLLTAVAESGLPVLAVDIPSGIHADTGAIMGAALPARLTVTMQALKAGLLLYPGADLCGEIAVAELGISLAPVVRPFANTADEGILRRVLLPRARRTHKGTYGRTALLCGSEGMSGAAVLAAKASLRSGAGLTEVLTPEANRLILQTALPEAIVMVRRDTESLAKAIQRADGVAIGCGLGTSEEAYEALRSALQALPADGSVPVVIDADGLTLLASHEELWQTALMASPKKQVVITPHPAEMSRLCGLSVKEILRDLPGTALNYARKRGITVVLKDAHTVIASPDGYLYICTAGNAGLAKGGSGDALTGVIASLLTQNRSRLGSELSTAETAAAGVCLHAAAADLAAEALGEYGLLATDVIERIPLLCKDFSDSRTHVKQICRA
ncbi:MAG: NAD(P)H-hydrate dehydratase [Ruminococcaceae bacterium]|nr:NAD(P)H-hydrate dehydratase [Oscillospiraceae bacterium]